MTLMQLFCSNGECEEEIIGRGVLIWDATESIDWESHGANNVLTTRLPTGEETQVLGLHLTCFFQMFREIDKQEQNVALTVVISGVGDLKAALSGEDED